MFQKLETLRQEIVSIVARCHISVLDESVVSKIDSRISGDGPNPTRHLGYGKSVIAFADAAGESTAPHLAN